MLHPQRNDLIIKLFFLDLQETLKFNIMGKRIWTDEEMIQALDLYFKLPFGKLCSTNKDGQGSLLYYSFSWRYTSCV
jgi:hypothetical protein